MSDLGGRGHTTGSAAAEATALLPLSAAQRHWRNEEQDNEIVGNIRSIRWRNQLRAVAIAIAVFFLAAVFLFHRHSGSGPYLKLLHAHGTGPRYRATQFVSFTINTFGGVQAAGECAGRSVDVSGTCYLGNAANLTEDTTHRLRILRLVLHRLRDDKTAKRPVIDQRTDVLKIFMLPEFFLRSPHGAFSMAEAFRGGILLSIADSVRELVKDPAFTDYLFVFGTVIAARSPNDPRKPWEHALNAREVLYYNFAPIYKGGPSHAHRFLVTKKYISTIDFLNRTTLPNPSNSGLREYSKISDRFRKLLKSRGTKLVENNLIEIDGLRIGIELCLDHRRGALWENLQKKRPIELVDVQLVSSAGMNIEAGPNPVVPGGVVYLTDGGASSAACRRGGSAKFRADKVCREAGKTGLKSLPQGKAGYSEFFTIEACIDVVNRPLLKGYYSLHQTQGCANTLKTYGIDVMDEYKEYLPSIEIYPTVQLPKNTY